MYVFTSLKYKEFEARYIRGQNSLTTLSENGLWLKEENSEDNSYYIIHSLGMDKKYGNIENVIFFNYQENGNLLRRIDDNAKLLDKKWVLSDAWIKEYEQSMFHKKYSIKTNLTIDQIARKLFPHLKLSLFGALPNFIAIAEEAWLHLKDIKPNFLI